MPDAIVQWQLHTIGILGGTKLAFEDGLLYVIDSLAQSWSKAIQRFDYIITFIHEFKYLYHAISMDIFSMTLTQR